MTGRGVVDWGHMCNVAHWCHWGNHDRGSNLMQSTVVRSSMYLMRVHNWRSVVDHRGSMVDHRGSMVDHWGSVVDHWG